MGVWAFTGILVFTYMFKQTRKMEFVPCIRALASRRCTAALPPGTNPAPQTWKTLLPAGSVKSSMASTSPWFSASLAVM